MTQQQKGTFINTGTRKRQAVVAMGKGKLDGGIERTDRRYVGTMVLTASDGRPFEYEVTFSGRNNTFFQGDSSVIIPEYKLVLGLWTELSSEGEVQIRKLRAYYLKKFPEHNRLIRERLQRPENPDPADLPLGALNIGIRSEGVDAVSQPAGNFYDLDSDFVEMAGPVEKADILPESQDFFVQRHNLLETMFDRHGFTVKEVPGPNFRDYRIKFSHSVLYNLRHTQEKTEAVLTPLLTAVFAKAGFAPIKQEFPLLNKEAFKYTAQDAETKKMYATVDVNKSRLTIVVE